MPEDSAPRTKYFSPASVEQHVVAADRGHDVERQTHQLEAEIERNQVGRRNQHQHAGRRQQDQHGVLEAMLLLAAEIVERHQDRDGRAGQRQQLQEAREVVDHEAAAERHQAPFRQHDERNAGRHQQHDRPDVDRLGGGFAAERTQHQQRHGADRQDDLRQGRQQRGNLGSFVHRNALPAFTAAPGRRPWRRRSPCCSCRAGSRPRPPTCRGSASGICRTAPSARPADRA